MTSIQIVPKPCHWFHLLSPACLGREIEGLNRSSRGGRLLYSRLLVDLKLNQRLNVAHGLPISNTWNSTYSQ